MTAAELKTLTHADLIRRFCEIGADVYGRKNFAGPLAAEMGIARRTAETWLAGQSPVPIYAVTWLQNVDELRTLRRLRDQMRQFNAALSAI
jgi:hypothetical protein